MPTARILPCTLIVVAMAAGVFTALAGAQASSLPQPTAVTGAIPQPVRIAEVIRKKPASQQARPRLAKERIKARGAHILKQKRSLPDEVVRDPGENSILLRIAPYDYTLG
jgi:hypothetical protein